MPSEFFRTSTTWVVDFRYDGRPRRWFRAFGPDVDVPGHIADELHALYGGRARLVEVRRATEEEERDYLRGAEPKNLICPTGRRGRSEHELSPSSLSIDANGSATERQTSRQPPARRHD